MPDLTDEQKAQAASAAEAAIRAAGGGKTLDDAAHAVSNVKKTVDKVEKVGEDIAAGAAAGAAIGSVFPGIGTAIGGVVGTVGGAVYGVIDQFGGDIVDFASDVGDWFSGPKPICGDFFGQKGSCDQIDRRCNNVVKMQRAIRADLTLLSLTVDGASKKFDVDPAFADWILRNERARAQRLSVAESGADHILHANPAFIAGRVTAFGVQLNGPESIAKAFGVSQQFAEQMYSAAFKLLKPVPPPRVTISKAFLDTHTMDVLRAASRASAPRTLSMIGGASVARPPSVDAAAATVVSAASNGDATAQAAIQSAINGARAGDAASAIMAFAFSDAQKIQIRAQYVAKWVYGAQSGNPISTGAVPPGCGCVGC